MGKRDMGNKDWTRVGRSGKGKDKMSLVIGEKENGNTNITRIGRSVKFMTRIGKREEQSYLYRIGKREKGKKWHTRMG